MATALITGGTSGIGAAFARQLAASGHDLVLVARDQARLAQTATELQQSFNIGVETLSADLAVAADVDRVAERLSREHEPIDVLVNNAGFGVRIKLTADDLSPHFHAIDVMIKAVLTLGGAAGRAMRARGSGAIINVSSTAGFMTMGGYSAIKAWVTAYSESLSNELNGSGVTVTALCPGWVRTEFHERASINPSSIPSGLWVDVDRLVRDCLADVAKGKVISMPSKRYGVLMFLVRHAPRSAVRSVSRKLSSKRH